MQERTRRQRRWWRASLVAGLLLLLLSGTALAAEFGEGTAYRLEEGQIIEDDLYVAGETVVIDGTVQGDLIAAGQTVEVNGTVTGDVIVAGAEVILNGDMEDDVRAAGAALEINGTIADDLVIAGGGNFSFRGEKSTIQPGVHISSESAIGGDVMIAAGEATFAGTADGDAWMGGGKLTLLGRIGGDAHLASQSLNVQDSASVGGTLEYESSRQIDIPPGVSPDVQYHETPSGSRRQDTPANPVGEVFGWLLRTVLIALGFALLGWLSWKFAPGLVTRTTETIESAPGKSALYGTVIMLLLMVIPLASLLLVLLVLLFWGWFPAFAVAIFLFGVLGLVWWFSPLLTGLWVGRWLMARAGKDASTMTALLAGMILLALVGRLPIIGWLVYLLSFVFALGGLALSRRTKTSTTPAAS